MSNDCQLAVRDRIAGYEWGNFKLRLIFKKSVPSGTEFSVVNVKLDKHELGKYRCFK
jgi:hypothetical protein